jgi:hypothetical protein
MNISWQYRQLKHPGPRRRRNNPNAYHCPHTTYGERFTVTPFVVASHSKDGKTRQTYVTCLPSIRTCCLNHAPSRMAWWERVHHKVLALEEAGRLKCLPVKDPTDAPFVVESLLSSKVNCLCFDERLSTVKWGEDPIWLTPLAPRPATGLRAIPWSKWRRPRRR